VINLSLQIDSLSLELKESLRDLTPNCLQILSPLIVSLFLVEFKSIEKLALISSSNFLNIKQNL
jgi:hypothetical protein